MTRSKLTLDTAACVCVCVCACCAWRRRWRKQQRHGGRTCKCATHWRMSYATRGVRLVHARPAAAACFTNYPNTMAAVQRLRWATAGVSPLAAVAASVRARGHSTSVGVATVLTVTPVETAALAALLTARVPPSPPAHVPPAHVPPAHVPPAPSPAVYAMSAAAAASPAAATALWRAAAARDDGDTYVVLPAAAAAAMLATFGVPPLAPPPAPTPALAPPQHPQTPQTLPALRAALHADSDAVARPTTAVATLAACLAPHGVLSLQPRGAGLAQLQVGPPRHRVDAAPHLPGVGPAVADMLVAHRAAAATRSDAVAVAVPPAATAALMDAARSGAVDAMRSQLAAAPADVARLMVRAASGDVGATPLHAFVATAAALADADVASAGIAALLAAGADVNARAGNGSTPLHWAAGAGALHAAAALLAAGADPCIPSYTWRRQVFGRGSGQLAIHWAAESNHVAVVRLLADADWTAAVAGDERGRTPRDVAAGEAATDAVAALTALEATPLVCLRIAVASTFAAPLPRRS